MSTTNQTKSPLGFRLKSIQLHTNNFKNQLIQFVENKANDSNNYVTLMIGKNGTGKSRVLSEIAKQFCTQDNINNNIQNVPDVENNSVINSINYPSKIIAIANGLSDKFHIDTYQDIRFNSRFNHQKLFYNYLGPKITNNKFSIEKLMDKTLEIVLDSYSNTVIANIYRHVFDYLDFEPIIKFKFTFNKEVLNKIDSENYFSWDKIYQNSSLDNQFFLSNNLYLSDIQYRVRNFINEYTKFHTTHENDLTINFSMNNIWRINEDSSLYDRISRDFQILQLVKEIGVLQSFEILVYKKRGQEFNITDASSGESNILTTLLALIPLVKDNALILIDEPEISLHPQWQVRYIELLNMILEHVKGCHVIIASHSPFLASSLTPNSSSVISLQDNNGYIESSFIEDSTLGWSVEDILLNVFEMESTRNQRLTILVSDALSLLSKYDRSSTQLKSINKELQIYYENLLDSDPLKSIILAIGKKSDE